MSLIEFLRNDEDLKRYREEWKDKFATPFPPFNLDEYNCIADYKEKIRKKLDSANQ